MLEKLDAGIVRAPQDRHPTPSKPTQRSFAKALADANAGSSVTAGPSQSQDHPSSGDERIGQAYVAQMGTGDHVLPGNAVQMHLTSKSGTQELVSLPWRLVAGWSLAHAISGSASTDQAKRLLQGTNRNDGALLSEALGEGGVPGAPLSRQNGSADGPMAEITSLVPSLDMREAESGTTLRKTSDAAAWGANGSWQSRLLRLIEREAGTHTAWVRDYRLSDDEVTEMVHRLRHLVEGQGALLDRVVVNAREVWNRNV